jgi:hypothetical protein
MPSPSPSPVKESCHAIPHSEFQGNIVKEGSSNSAVRRSLKYDKNFFENLKVNFRMSTVASYALTEFYANKCDDLLCWNIEALTMGSRGILI